MVQVPAASSGQDGETPDEAVSIPPPSEMTMMVTTGTPSVSSFDDTTDEPDELEHGVGVVHGVTVTVRCHRHQLGSRSTWSS